MLERHVMARRVGILGRQICLNQVVTFDLCPGRRTVSVMSTDSDALKEREPGAESVRGGGSQT